MSLTEVLEQLEQLDDEEVAQVQAYLARRANEARARQFEKAVAALQAGLSPAEVAEIKQVLSRNKIVR